MYVNFNVGEYVTQKKAGYMWGLYVGLSFQETKSLCR